MPWIQMVIATWAPAGTMQAEVMHRAGPSNAVAAIRRPLAADKRDREIARRLCELA